MGARQRQGALILPGDYRPIACAAHERLEFAVLRRQSLQLNWLGEDGLTQFDERVLPIDVETRAGAEWLSCKRLEGDVVVIRLDHILALSEP